MGTLAFARPLQSVTLLQRPRCCAINIQTPDSLTVCAPEVLMKVNPRSPARAALHSRLLATTRVSLTPCAAVRAGAAVTVWACRPLKSDGASHSVELRALQDAKTRRITDHADTSPQVFARTHAAAASTTGLPAACPGRASTFKYLSHLEAGHPVHPWRQLQGNVNGRGKQRLPPHLLLVWNSVRPAGAVLSVRPSDQQRRETRAGSGCFGPAERPWRICRETQDPGPLPHPSCQCFVAVKLDPIPKCCSEVKGCGPRRCSALRCRGTRVVTLEFTDRSHFPRRLSRQIIIACLSLFICLPPLAFIIP